MRAFRPPRYSRVLRVILRNSQQMSDFDQEQVLEFAIALAKKAGKVIVQGSDVSNHGELYV